MGDAVDKMVAKVKQVRELGQTHGVTFDNVAAAFGGKLTWERFRGFIADEEAHPKVIRILEIWLGMIKSKKEGLTKILPTHKDTTPTQGLPKAKPLSSEELGEKLTKLLLLSERVGVGLEQAVQLKSGAMTMDMLQGLIASSDDRKRTAATLSMEKWTKAIRERANQIEKQRGLSPKQSTPVPPTLSSGASWVAFGIDEEGRRQTLEAHNRARKQYGVPPLQYEPRLEPNALEWAAYLAANNKFEHCSGRKTPGFDGALGENLAMSASWGSAWAPGHATRVQGYVDEVKDYDMVAKKKKPGGGAIGHFTQVIWRDTKVVGCGHAVIKTPDGWSTGIWVHRYHPAGNAGEDPWK